jgi:hypothetical protein
VPSLGEERPKHDQHPQTITSVARNSEGNNITPGGKGLNVNAHILKLYPLEFPDCWRVSMGCTPSSRAPSGPSAGPTSATMAVKAKPVRRRDPSLKPEDFVATGLDGATFVRRPG